MLKYIQSISIFLIMQSAIYANELSANETLEKAIKRIDGIDHEMQIEIKSKDKNNKLERQIFKFLLCGNLIKKNINLYILGKPKGKKKGRQLWVHTYKDGKEKMDKNAKIRQD